MKWTVVLVSVLVLGGVAALIGYRATRGTAYNGPSGAFAECNDGAYAFQGPDNACLYHGGVKVWNPDRR